MSQADGGGGDAGVAGAAADLVAEFNDALSAPSAMETCYGWMVVTLPLESRGGPERVAVLSAALPALAAVIRNAPPDADLAVAAAGLFHFVAINNYPPSCYSAFALVAAEARRRGGKSCTEFGNKLTAEFMYYFVKAQDPKAFEQASRALEALAAAAAGDEALLARCADGVSRKLTLATPHFCRVLAEVDRLMPAAWSAAAARALVPARTRLERMRTDGTSPSTIANAEAFLQILELAAARDTTTRGGCA
jgi:hypothetical protein